MPNYMPYGYPWMASGFRNGGNHDRRGHYGRKKNFHHGNTVTEVVYSKKPTPISEEERNKLESGASKLVLKDTKTTTIEGDLTANKLKARYFVIKSYSEQDVHKAIKHNCWCSTKDGNVKLHDAFVESQAQYPIYLLFSVNSSGHFVGVAQMKSAVDFEKNFPGWDQSHKWKGLFKLSWIFIKDVPNRELRHLKNEYNEGKPVPNSRDCQEVPGEVGAQVLEIFEIYKNTTSILDDYEFYELQEKNHSQNSNTGTISGNVF